MLKNDTAILPLYHFFERLRQNDFPLGVGDYQKLLYVLTRHFGLGLAGYETMVEALHHRTALTGENNFFPKAGLLRLCKLLWLKPNQSMQLFEELFEASYGLEFASLGNARETAPAQNTAADGATSDETREEGALPGDTGELPEEPLAEDFAGAACEEEEVPVRVRVSAQQPDARFHFNATDTLQLEKSKFLFTQNYFPVDRRKIQQNLRAFPAFRLSYPSNQLDIEATIKNTVDNGLFHEVIWKKQKLNTNYLLLLIDDGDSMVAMRPLATILKEELEAIFPRKHPKEHRLQTFYFYNAAAASFFKDKAHTESESAAKVLQHLKTKQGAVMIVSDAGAATGAYHKDRILAAQNLLAQLHNCTTKVTWLNPMPKSRWNQSSAEVIARNVAMFETTENGIKNAVDFLKGTSIKIIQAQ